MNILLRIILLIFLVFAGQSYATTAMSYGYEVNIVQPGVVNLNNNGLINPSGCCSKLSSRDSQDRAQARDFFAFTADFYVPKGPVPAGANLVGAGDDLARAIPWIKPQKGVFDVVVHGSEDAFHVLHNGKWVQLDQRSLATFMKQNGYSGGQVRLLSCSTGSCSSGIAQDLSNKLGARVTAPSDTLWIHPNRKRGQIYF